MNVTALAAAAHLRAEMLSMHYNDAGRVIELFSNLSLEVGRGQSLAIVGESGIGKTTLLYLLGGLEQPVSGEVWVGGTCFSALADDSDKAAAFRGKEIGFVFQFHYLLPEFDALENVAMPLIIQGERKEKAFERAKFLLERVGLSHRLEHRPTQLSGGEQQRVAVARAFVARPSLVLADEPTGNLDVKTASEVHKLLAQMQREEETTLVVVTHSKDLANSLDRSLELTRTGFITK